MMQLCRFSLTLQPACCGGVGGCQIYVFRHWAEGGALVLSINKKEWICSLFKEWILEKSEIRVNLEWIWSEHLCYSLILEWPQGSLRDSEPLPWDLVRKLRDHSQNWVNNTNGQCANVIYKFTLISLYSKIHSLKSEHVHSYFILD